MKTTNTLLGFLAIGFALWFGTTVQAQTDYAQSPENIRAQAEKGNAKAQYDYGCYLADNRQDWRQAYIWYRKSAEQNYVGAQFVLGVYYEHGYGINSNPVEAYKWYLLAASKDTIYKTDAKTLANTIELTLTQGQISKAKEDFPFIAKEYLAEDLLNAKIAQAKIDAQNKADAQQKLDDAANAEAQAKIDVEVAKVKAEAAAKAEAQAKIDAEAAKAKAEAQAKIDAQIEAETQAKIDAQIKADAAAKVEAQAKIDAQIKADAAAKLEAQIKASAEFRRNGEIAAGVLAAIGLLCFVFRKKLHQIYANHQKAVAEQRLANFKKAVSVYDDKALLEILKAENHAKTAPDFLAITRQEAESRGGMEAIAKRIEIKRVAMEQAAEELAIEQLKDQVHRFSDEELLESLNYHPSTSSPDTFHKIDPLLAGLSHKEPGELLAIVYGIVNAEVDARGGIEVLKKVKVPLAAQSGQSQSGGSTAIQAMTLPGQKSSFLQTASPQAQTVGMVCAIVNLLTFFAFPIIHFSFIKFTIYQLADTIGGVTVCLWLVPIVAGVYLFFYFQNRPLVSPLFVKAIGASLVIAVGLIILRAMLLSDNDSSQSGNKMNFKEFEDGFKQFNIFDVLGLGFYATILASATALFYPARGTTNQQPPSQPVPNQPQAVPVVTEPNPGTGILTLPEVANRLRISLPEATTLVESGGLKAKKIGEQWRVSEAALTAFINQ